MMYGNRYYMGVYTAQELERKHRRWCDEQMRLGTPEGMELRRQREERLNKDPSLQTYALAMLLARAAK